MADKASPVPTNVTLTGLTKDQFEPTDPPKEKTSETSSIEKVYDGTVLTNNETTITTPGPGTPKGARFWLAFISLLFASLAANLNATILSTLLPTIVEAFDGEQDYVWVAASFNIASTAILPLCGQVSDIFGRRVPMITSLVLFVLGSGILGGASGMEMLIAGRTVQGLGAGGIMMLLEIICCDLLPLRERSKYLSYIFMVNGVAVTIGPTVGGAFATKTTWRWAFYINLPIGGIAILLAILFLNLKSPHSPSWRTSMLRIDYVGNFVFIASTCSMLVGLVMGGQIYPWSSWRVIVPIVLGGVGWIVFYLYQFTPYCKEPTMPPRLFSNRTAVSGFVFVFISHMMLEWVVYFMPFYFQALKGASSLTSGVNTLPFNIFLIPCAGVAGGVLYKTGQYKPIHWTGFGFLSLASGLFSTMDTGTAAVKWAFWQLFAAAGIGALIGTTLPAIQSSLPESDVASSAAVHAFLRSYGFIWGFVIPSVIFNDQINANIKIVEDPTARALIVGGSAYSQVDGGIRLLPAETQTQVSRVYTLALQSIWYAACAFSLVGFLFVFVEKKIELRKELDTEYGLADAKEKSGKADGTATESQEK
ncbi:major facilitator superfamily domain-containing protein [Amylocarpus encephaloides]|uniref:Major facilitator superfamily domain-containing protein n=1 Tax=Amylocarpus encephaloides TaxID=45428 RepID=A0A9P7YCY5_9HELO|nr:major facilitator superfamily domain-containing protein [Amylocarpus encephaloides]